MKNLLLSLTILLVSANLMFAGQIEKTYTFSNPQITEAEGYQMITFENTLLTGITGEPVLPYAAVSLLLPPGEVATKIEIIPGNEVIVNGRYQLYPKQYVQPLSKGKSGIFVKNELLYQQDLSYPGKMQGELSTEYMNGYAVAFSAFTPVTYNPATGQVSYYESVTVCVYSESGQRASSALQNLNSSQPVLERLTGLIQNQEAVKDYPTRDQRNDDYQMLIITPAQFEDDFQQLVDFYSPRGLTALIATTEYIYANMTGQDNKEKIRNYIIQEYQDHGVQHVTLGGDVEHVPYRGFYCTVQSSSVYEDDNIPSDLYFSGLDGTWNDNGNNLWGEIGEDDLLPEIGIGRFSVSNQDEMDALMNKTISYQGSPVLGELRDPFLVGEWLYSSPETYGADYLDLLIGYQNENGYETTGIPEDHNIETLYERDQSWSASTLMQKINEGHTFIHHVGHANTTYTMKFYNSDITNSNFSQVNGVTHNYPLIFSHGCICGDFTSSDCIAERMINIDNFAAAVLMNSRYGWFNEGQTEGPAAHLHRELVDALYTDKEAHLGMAYSISRIATAPWVTAPGQWEEGALRWNFYDCNVLGDGALRVWTDEPTDITATYQDAIPIGVPSISITVNGNGGPIEGLYCVFMKDGVSYGMAQTDATGLAEIEFTEVIADLGDASIYVSGYNCQLNEFPVTIIPNGGAYVVYESSEINDINGNNNGIPEYNESVMLTTEMKNVGTVQADNVVVTLTSSDPYVTITDDTEDFGNIAGGASVNMEDAFAFDIDATTPNQHAISFTVQAVGQDTWSSSFSVVVCSPALSFTGFVVDDGASGNNNGHLDPGETADVIVAVANEGDASAYEVTAMMSSTDPYMTVNTTAVQDIGDLNPGNGDQVTFSVTVADDIPAGYTATLDLMMEAMYGIEVSDEISVVFADYCEASTGTEDEFIENVSFGDIENSSGWQGGIANYTDMITVLEAGASEQITIENGNAWASDLVTVWIDWNVDMEFGSQSNETFVLTNVGGSGQTFEGTITVPDNQMAAHYRMRIRMTYSSAPEPCGEASYGEIEDYTVVIAGGVLAVNVTCTPDEICVGDESQLMANAGGGSGSFTYLWTPSTGLSNPAIYNPVASPGETTDYTVEVNDGSSTVSEQLTLTVHQLPETPFINLTGNTLHSDASEGNQWYDSQGPISGATGQSYECTWEDVYHVVVTSEFGCESFPSNSIHVVVTGIGDNETGKQLSIYPNPFTDKLFIEFSIETGLDYTLAIYNSLGKEVAVIAESASGIPGLEKYEFDSESLNNGIYFVKLITPENVIISKIICTR
nr:T9SS type A sorting domain-containing protein [Bacteroidota bacterium]